MRWLVLPCLLALAIALPACRASQGPQAPSWDTQVPASEPRAELTLLLGLPPVSDCDERFALGMYEDRGVELLSWAEDSAARQRCRERRVTVRYLPRRLTRDDLLLRARRFSKSVEVVER
jgi:hypothetical protein